jgi:DNA polymerase-3 subunit delta
VNGLLDRFEPRGKPGRAKKSAKAAKPQNDYQAFGACAGNIPESTVLVMIDGKLGDKNPLFKELSRKATVKSFPLLTGDRLRQWIQRRVKEEGGSISPQAVELLAGLVGGDLWIMSNEISKLVSFASGRRIEEEDVRKVVSSAQEASVFAMVDAILEFRTAVAQQLLQQLLQRGAAPAYLLVMLARQVRIVFQVKELKRQRKSNIEIQNMLGIRSDFVLRKASEQANRYPWGRLRDVYNKLLEADLSIKTGKYDGELALDILLAEICQRE